MSAATDYRNALTDARNLLELIKCEIEARAQLLEIVNVDYGHVGDMEHLRRHLRTALATIMGNADGGEILAQIDEVLDEARLGGL